MVLHTLSHLINGRLAQDQESFQILANKNDKVGLHLQRVRVLVPETQHPILFCKKRQRRLLLRDRSPTRSPRCHLATPHSGYIIQSWLLTGSCESSAQHPFGSCDLLEYIQYPLKSCSSLALLILLIV